MEQQVAGAGVSFVVPVFNKRPWLPAVIAGLKNQRGDFPREFIFVDDGSTDGSSECLRELTAGWSEARVITQANAGSAAATNAGIRAASLPFIKFCDADDVLMPGATLRLLSVLRSRNGACLAWGDRILYRDLEDLPADLPDEPRYRKVTRVAAPIEAAMRNSLFNPSQFLVRTACAQAVGGCDERIVFSQEYSLTLRLAHRWEFVQIEAPVAFVQGDAPGRLSGNRGRQLQRVTLALANFLRDTPDLEPRLKRFACRRAAGRAWKWRLRHHGEGPMSVWFWRNVQSQLLPPRDAVAFIETCATAFDDSGDPLPASDTAPAT